MKLRRFTDAGVAKTRAFLAAVKESNDVDTVTLDGEPFTRAAFGPQIVTNFYKWIYADMCRMVANRYCF
jgi:hypothetical protein